MRRRHFVRALALPAFLPFAAHAGALDAEELGLRPDGAGDQSLALQTALRRAARTGRPLFLPGGTYRVSNIELPHRVAIEGAGARLRYNGGGTFLVGRGCERLRMGGLELDAGHGKVQDPRSGALDLADCADIVLRDCRFRNTANTGLRLERCGGHVTQCLFENTDGLAAIFSLDAMGLHVSDNRVRGAADGGILVYRSTSGPDGTVVARNRLEDIGAASGGTGPYGNAINVVRAHGVRIEGNHVSRAAFSAVRCHSASNAAITGNTALECGETAIYSEFAFEGAAIVGNVVDGAAIGISMANFDHGGRLAVCANNLVRNLRDGGPYPAQTAGFGHGIYAEADTAVSGNVVDEAARWGIALGWGPYLRNVAVTGNVVRAAGTGLVASVVEGAGSALVADNVLQGRHGSIVGHAWLEPRTGDLLGRADVPANLALAGNRR